MKADQRVAADANGGRLEGIDTVGKAVTFRYSSLKPSWRIAAFAAHLECYADATPVEDGRDDVIRT